MSTVYTNTGRLRHKGEVQQESKSRDAMGGETISWVKVTNGDAWAEVRPKSATETINGAQITQDVTHVIRMRPIPGTTITPSMRFYWNSRAFNFTQVINTQERGILIEILAKEDVNA